MEDRVIDEDLEAARADWAASLGGEEWACLFSYVHLLYRWSASMNLVSPDDRPVLATKHLQIAVDLTVLARTLPHRTIIDIGSGAGLPGVPLAVLLPESQVYLVESRRRRCHFLKEVVRRLGLTGTTVVHDRVEAWSGPVGGADLVTARAVAPLPELFSLAAPHLACWGGLLATLPAGGRHPCCGPRPSLIWPMQSTPSRSTWGLFFRGRATAHEM